MESGRAWFIFLIVASSMLGCDSANAPTGSKAPPPAKVQQYSDENSLATVTLTAEAEKRLGITTVPVERKEIKRQRTFSGEVVVPPGRSIIVSAPLSGTIVAPQTESGSVPPLGGSVKKGQPIFSFLPLLSPERSVLTPSERVRLAEANASLASTRVEAQGLVEKAKVEVDAAEIELQRAQQLLSDKVGSARTVDQAKARLSLAQKELEAAVARERLLAKTILDADAGTLVPGVVHSPQDGVLQNLHVAVGQTVAAGAPLFEVVNQDLVWIRVPVYVGDLGRIDTGAESLVGNPADLPNTTMQSAKPIIAPPSANPDAATVDLFYEMENRQGRFRGGQRVAATLTLQDLEESLVAPWPAVLHDIHGGTWVYQKIDDHTFRRGRVQVRYVVDSVAVLASGPEPGTLVVTDGAAELYGTEFGHGK